MYVHMTWREFMSSDRYERAEAIAHYRTHLLLEAHISDAQERTAGRRRGSQRGPRRGGGGSE